MRVLRVSLLVGEMVLLCACASVAPSASSLSPSVSASTTPSASVEPKSVTPSPLAGGCGSTQVFAGPGPDGSGPNAVTGLDANQWALAAPASSGIIAYFWGDLPLLVKAPPPPGKGNKILWISHSDALGELAIVAHPIASGSPIVRFSLPRDGFSFPSTIDLPSSGCWHLDLTLGSVHATIDLSVAD